MAKNNIYSINIIKKKFFKSYLSLKGRPVDKFIVRSAFSDFILSNKDNAVPINRLKNLFQLKNPKIKYTFLGKLYSNFYIRKAVSIYSKCRTF